MIRNFIFSLAMLICLATRQQPDFQVAFKVKNAVAITGIAGTEYYVLTSERAVYHYRQSDAGVQFVNRFSLQSPGTGLDLALGRTGQQDSVVVTQWDRDLRLGVVYRYTPEGEVVGKWTLQHIPGGVYFDALQGEIYFNTVDTSDIYKVDVRGKSPHYVCNIFGARQLGPVAIDLDRQILYTTDALGQLFRVDLNSGKSSPSKLSFGLPSALLFHGRLLYVADPVTKKIYAVDPSTSSRTVIAESRQLSSASGLALGPGETLLITDEHSGSVFLTDSGASRTANITQEKPERNRKAH